MIPRRPLAVVLVALGLAGCNDLAPEPEVLACDQACRDGVAMRAMREMMKLLYNLTIQGKPVGPQDHALPCPFGGAARVSGEVSSNAEQGTTEVKLTYEFSACGYLQVDDEANENYELKLSGTFRQEGTLTAQSSATTALVIKGEKVSLEGTVHDPPQAYKEQDCTVEMNQNGNSVSGKICGRNAGFTF
jgi:hypothetical protein